MDTNPAPSAFLLIVSLLFIIFTLSHQAKGPFSEPQRKENAVGVQNSASHCRTAW
jgi:hypothetical protein